jgi:hypothetical protein
VSEFKKLEFWYSKRQSRREAEKWAAKEVTSAYALMDMETRAPDSFNRALSAVVERESSRLVKETIHEMREMERKAFLDAMPEIQILSDALARFKKGELA